MLPMYVDFNKRLPLPLALKPDELREIFASHNIEIVDDICDARLRLCTTEDLREKHRGALPRDRVVLFEGEPPQPNCLYPAYRLRGFAAILTPVAGLAYSPNNLAYFRRWPKRRQKSRKIDKILQLATVRSNLQSAAPLLPENCTGRVNGVVPYAYRALGDLRARVGLALKKRDPELIDLCGRGWPEGTALLEDSRDIPSATEAMYWSNRKIELLGEYGFNLAWENMEIPGYVTEKFWHSVLGGALPLYWGAPEFHQQIPKDTAIDCRSYLRPGGFDVEQLRYDVTNMSEKDYLARMETLHGWHETFEIDCCWDAIRETAYDVAGYLLKIDSRTTVANSAAQCA